MAKRKTTRTSAAPADVTDELSNPENFVDGIGYRAKCAIGDCDEVTDGGAVIRTTGARFSLCVDHRNPEGLAEAVAEAAATSEDEESRGDGGGGQTPPA